MSYNQFLASNFIKNANFFTNMQKSLFRPQHLLTRQKANEQKQNKTSFNAKPALRLS